MIAQAAKTWNVLQFVSKGQTTRLSLKPFLVHT